jgi:hypothetical protein
VIEKIKKKNKETCLDKYGVEYALQVEKFKQNKIETVYKKYQVNNILQLPEIQEKIKKTMKEKYGADHHTRTESYQLKRKLLSLEKQSILCLTDGTSVRDRILLSEFSQSHGYKIYKFYGEQVFLNACNKYEGKRIYHTTEMILMQILSNDFPQLQKYDKTPLEFKTSRRPDFRIEHHDKVLYINTDGLYEHSIVGRVCKGDKRYHYNLRNSFNENGATIFQFREDELRDKSKIVKSIILNYFEMYEKKYNARDLQVKNVSNDISTDYFSANHLMGADANSFTTSFGLYRDNELVSCISIKYYNRLRQIKIVRYCSKTHQKVHGGFSKLLRHIEDIYRPIQIISFCDSRYALGHSYENLGFQIDGVTLGWKWTDGKETYNRLICR